MTTLKKIKNQVGSELTKLTEGIIQMKNHIIKIKPAGTASKPVRDPVACIPKGDS